MSFSAYGRYRRSDVPWLGAVPAHWGLSRVRWLFSVKKRIAGELGRDVFSITQNGIRVKDLDSNDGQMAMDYSKYQLVEVGDFVMNPMDLLTGGVDIAVTSGVTSPDYRVVELKPHVEANPKYFLYVFQTGYRRHIFYAYGQGSAQLGRWRLPTDQFRDLVFPLPPTEEQDAIVSLLDSETKRIDALIAEQRRLIELLQEKRQAVISHAVTKGLSPDVPMKASGISSIGEVPTHWDIGPVKRFFQSLDGRRIPLSAEERGSRQGPYPYYGASGIIDHVDGYLFDEELVLVGEDGANLLNRSTPVAFTASGQYWVNNHAHVLKPRDRSSKYWAERIDAIDLTPVVTGSAQPKLTAEALGGLRIAAPADESETRAIQMYIEAIDQQTASLVAESERAIALLWEHRTALISAAVTGQIDVRGLAPSEAA